LHHTSYFLKKRRRYSTRLEFDCRSSHLGAIDMVDNAFRVTAIFGAIGSINLFVDCGIRFLLLFLVVVRLK